MYQKINKRTKGFQFGTSTLLLAPPSPKKPQLLHRFLLCTDSMAKNRNKKKRNGAVSMDTTEPSVSEAPQAMDTSESRAQNTVACATNISMKIKQTGRPMKRSKNVRKMKAIAKAISSNDKSVEKMLKDGNKKIRVQSAKTLYE